MVGIYLVQQNKIAFVYAQYCPSVLGGKRQHLFIRSSLVSVPRFQGSQNIVAQDT